MLSTMQESVRGLKLQVGVGRPFRPSLAVLQACVVQQS